MVLIRAKYDNPSILVRTQTSAGEPSGLTLFGEGLLNLPWLPSRL